MLVQADPTTVILFNPKYQVLMPKLRDPSPGVTSQVLAAVGELASVGREILLPFSSTLMPILLEMIQDQSSSTKREAALRTLGLLAKNTGDVIDPYLKFPNLLNILLNILKTEQVPSTRIEAITVLGILGALDPYRQKVSPLAFV